jgi:hypothetical protein
MMRIPSRTYEGDVDVVVGATPLDTALHSVQR